MPSQRYAIDGAILLKSVEENTQEIEVLDLLCKSGKLLITVTNAQDEERSCPCLIAPMYR